MADAPLTTSLPIGEEGEVAVEGITEPGMGRGGVRRPPTPPSQAGMGFSAKSPRRAHDSTPLPSEKRARMSVASDGIAEGTQRTRLPSVEDDDDDEDGSGFHMATARILQNIRDEAKELHTQPKDTISAMSYRRAVTNVLGKRDNASLLQAFELDVLEDAHRATMAGYSSIEAYLESFYDDGQTPVQARPLLYDASDVPEPEIMIPLDGPAPVHVGGGGLGAEFAVDPRPRVTARNSADLTLPTPLFKDKELERKVKELRRMSQRGADATGKQEARTNGADTTGRGAERQRRKWGPSPSDAHTTVGRDSTEAKATRSKGAPLGPYEGDWRFFRADTGDWSPKYSHEYLKAAAREGKLGLRFGETKIHRESDNMWLPLREEIIRPWELARPSKVSLDLMRQTVRVLDNPKLKENARDEITEEQRNRMWRATKGLIPLQLRTAFRGRFESEFLSFDNSTNKAVQSYLIGRAFAIQTDNLKKKIISEEDEKRIAEMDRKDEEAKARANAERKNMNGNAIMHLQPAN